MAILFELILPLLYEFLLQAAIELLLHFGLSCVTEALDGKPAKNPTLAITGYAIKGLVAGGISLIIFPVLFVHNEALRLANVIVTPLLMGFLMSALGTLRERKRLTAIKLDSFACGFAFAFGIAVIRFYFGAK